MTQRKVREIMMSGVVTVQVGQSARQAQHLMQKHRVHALPVMGKEGELLGIVTSTDLIGEHDPDSIMARFMTKDLIAVGPEASIEAAAGLMRENEVHHLVVVEDGKLVGMLSTFDLLYLMEKADVPRRQSLVEADDEA